MLESLRTTFLMVKEPITGQMEENILVIGKTLKWTVKEYTLGLMEGSMMEVIKTILRMDMESFYGQMDRNMRVIGHRVRKMARGH